MSHASPSIQVLQSSEQEWSERTGTLMAWALRTSSRRAIHISMLARAETGLACGCVCPACDGVLQAVNAGRAAHEFLQPGSKRPFFRHHTGQQGEACLQRVAQMAALALLAEKQELVLPAPTFRRSVLGISGDLYSGEVVGSAYRGRVRERRWIDEQAATITLDDGRVVLLCLSGRQHVALDGQVDAVVTIAIDDPLVSTWGPDEILARVQLEDRWLCWESHWDDAELGAAALEQAKQRAREALDLPPGDLDLPEGLNQLQRSESVLHAVLKQILSETQVLSVPGFEGAVEGRTRSGRVVRCPYRRPPFEMRLANVRLESRLGSIVPDVISDAQDVRGQFPAVELIVEVAVTHRVDATKAACVEALGVACLELDATLLARGRTIKLQELRTAVRGDPSNKRWIFHPQLAQLRAQAAADVDRAIAADHEREDRIEARRAWLASAPLPDVVTAYITQVRDEAAAMGRPGAQGGGLVDAGEIGKALAARGLRGTTDVALPTALLRVAAIRDEPRRRLPLAREAIEAAMKEPDGRKWVTLLTGAVEAFAPGASGSDAEAIRALSAQVHSEVAEGRMEWARPRAFDALIAAAFPELVGFLGDARGTVDQAEAFRAMVAAQRQEAAREKAAKDAATQAHEEERRRAASREARLAELALTYSWRKAGDGGIRTPEAAQRLVKNLFPLEDPATRNALVDAAWQARGAGAPVAEFILDRAPDYSMPILISDDPKPGSRAELLAP